MKTRNFKEHSTCRKDGLVYDVTLIDGLWFASVRTDFGGKLLTGEGFTSREVGIEYVAQYK